MKKKIIFFGLLAGAGVFALWLWNDGARLDPTKSPSSRAQTANSTNQASPASGTEPASPDRPPLLAAKPADTPRQRDSLGRALPFREANLAPDFLSKIREAKTDSVFLLALFPDVSFRVKVTGRWDDAQGVRIAMVLLDYPEGDRFFISWHQGSVQGLVEIASRNLAYEILQEGTAKAVVREWLLTDRVCATPQPDHSAVRGIPPPSGSIPPSGSPQGIEPGQVPVLRSNPSVDRVVYLDFDGETIGGTVWANGDTIVAQPARLSATQIQEVWNRVCRDFDPFTVNITTLRSDYENAPANQRMHGIVTPTDTAARGAGGVAYLHSFYNGHPAFKHFWVFVEGNAKSCAEATSHEIGHTLGLSHDGRVAEGANQREEYYRGHGSGAAGWAPIMGVGYDQPLTQWSRGEYARANNPEDDLAIIGEIWGLPFQKPDHGSATNNATAVSGTQVIGRAEKATLADLLQVQLGAGSHTMLCTPAQFGNLDVKLEVLNEFGQVLSTGDPAGPGEATASFSLDQPGRVFLRLSSVGQDNPLESGYSSYGSLGSYTLTGFSLQRQAPSVPLNLTTAPVSGSQVRLTWTAHPFANQYQVRRNGTLIATTTLPEYLDTNLRASTSYVYEISAENEFGSSPTSPPVTRQTMAANAFLMDGAPDFSGYLLSNPGMTIYAAVRGTRLYVATWSSGNHTNGLSDHFIMISDTLLNSPSSPAPWAKAGQMAISTNKPYLAGESTSQFAAWFNAPSNSLHFKSPVNSGVLEGSLDLLQAFGRIPDYLYVAATAYATADGGTLAAQAPPPVGTPDNNLDPGEFLMIPVAAIVDSAQDGTYDILDPARKFMIHAVSLDSSNRPLLAWKTFPGRSYTVWRRANLIETTWTQLRQSQAGSGEWEMIYTDTNAPAPRAFYKITSP